MKKASIIAAAFITLAALPAQAKIVAAVPQTPAAEKPADTPAAPAPATAPADAPAAAAAEAKTAPAAETAAAPTAGTTTAPAAGATTAAAARSWQVVADKSSITFHGSQMGTTFSGTVGKFTPVINFDADHLDQSKVTVDIDTASLDAQDKERNENIKSKEWFDTPEFPIARFETTGFTKTGDNAFTADANLTIRGVTVPVQLPFTLALSKVADGKDSGKDQAVMTGKIILDRAKFQLGQGDWADPTIIANEVPVDITVTAVSDSAKPAEGNPAP